MILVVKYLCVSTTETNVYVKFESGRLYECTGDQEIAVYLCLENLYEAFLNNPSPFLS